MADGDDGSSALDKAVRALARRDHSTESLRAKLDRAGISGPAQNEAVETLARVGYLDDARFARDRAAQLASRGYGDLWIRADLEAQGVEGEAAEPALAALEPEPERALREADKLRGGLKAVRSLGRRGFSDDALEQLVSQVVAEEP